jgi:hypothetical protein
VTLTPQPYNPNLAAEQRAQATIAAEQAPGYTDTYSDPIIAARDPVGARVDPVPAVILDIPANEPYPTGNPYQPSWAEINGVHTLTGDQAPIEPVAASGVPRGEINTSGLAPVGG